MNRAVLAAVAAAAFLLCLGSVAQASITIDTVRVGDPGNAADTVVHSGNPAGQGSVSYTYNVGKYEVTAAQYTAFLNAVAKTDTYGLYNSLMWSSPLGCKIQRIGTQGSYSYSVASDYADRPVNCVSFWDSCRFANWLGNGQKTGVQDATTTETGAYTLNGYTGTDGHTIQRNANWTWALASEDEWYKAAYYKGGSTDAGYWLYPTQSNSTPGRDVNDLAGNNANYYGYDTPIPIQPPYYTTVAGEFQDSDSAYGTFDQGGNVWEWNELVGYVFGGYAGRGERGGSFGYGYGYLESSCRQSYASGVPTDEVVYIGFRVVQIVPEPSSIIAMLGGLAGLLTFRRSRLRGRETLAQRSAG